MSKSVTNEALSCRTDLDNLDAAREGSAQESLAIRRGKDADQHTFQRYECMQTHDTVPLLLTGLASGMEKSRARLRLIGAAL